MIKETVTVLMCGVGGQGTILAADLLARCAFESGDKVKMSEIHGMSQRGGAVTTVVRIGEDVASMVADIGNVDYLVSFETTEALRNISFVKAGGKAIVSDATIKPLTALTGKVAMPQGARPWLKEQGALVIPAQLMAEQAGSPKAVNVVLIGVLSAFLPYDTETWERVIREKVPPKFVDINLKAFAAGRALALEHEA